MESVMSYAWFTHTALYLVFATCTCIALHLSLHYKNYFNRALCILFTCHVQHFICIQNLLNRTIHGAYYIALHASQQLPKMNRWYLLNGTIFCYLLIYNMSHICYSHIVYHNVWYLLVVQYYIRQPYEVTWQPKHLQSSIVFRVPRKKHIVPLLVQPYIGDQHLVLFILEQTIIKDRNETIYIYSPVKEFEYLQLPLSEILDSCTGVM